MAKEKSDLQQGSLDLLILKTLELAADACGVTLRIQQLAQASLPVGRHI